MPATADDESMTQLLPRANVGAAPDARMTGAYATICLVPSLCYGEPPDVRRQSTRAMGRVSRQEPPR